MHTEHEIIYSRTRACMLCQNNILATSNITGRNIFLIFFALLCYVTYFPITNIITKTFTISEYMYVRKKHEIYLRSALYQAYYIFHRWTAPKFLLSIKYLNSVEWHLSNASSVSDFHELPTIGVSSWHYPSTLPLNCNLNEIS